MGLIALRLAGMARALPLWLWAVAAVLAWGGWQHHRAKAAGAELVKRVQAEKEAELAATRGALLETSRRIAAQAEVGQHGQVKLEAAVAALDGSRAAAERVQHRARAAGRAACAAAVAGAGPAASTASLVPAELFDRVVDSARKLAGEADRRGIAGAECEARYDALTPP